MPMSWAMTRSVCLLFVIFVTLVTGLFLALEGASLIPGYQSEQERILVFVVGSRAGVERVRRAVDPARILASSPDAIALAEGRMVVSNAEAVGGPFVEAGWIDRPIEMFHLERSNGLNRSRSSKESNSVDPERLAKLRALVHKRTLSRGEQLMVMQAMNDGVDF
jgi:hypothetical protein